MGIVLLDLYFYVYTNRLLFVFTNHSHFTKDRVTQSPLKTEQVQKDKQQSTNHTHKTKDRVTRTPLKTEQVQKDKQQSINHTHKTKD